MGETREQRLQALLASRTWRWTAPLRAAAAWLPLQRLSRAATGVESADEAAHRHIEALLNSRTWRWSSPVRTAVARLLGLDRPPPGAPIAVEPVAVEPPRVVRLPIAQPIIPEALT